MDPLSSRHSRRTRPFPIPAPRPSALPGGRRLAPFPFRPSPGGSLLPCVTGFVDTQEREDPTATGRNGKGARAGTTPTGNRGRQGTGRDPATQQRQRDEATGAQQTDRPRRASRSPSLARCSASARQQFRSVRQRRTSPRSGGLRRCVDATFCSQKAPVPLGVPLPVGPSYPGPAVQRYEGEHPELRFVPDMTSLSAPG